MLSADEVESLNCTIQQFDKRQVVDRLRQFKGRFPVDFTPEFFEREPVSRLRHILFGLCLHHQQLLEPHGPMAVAA